MIDLVTQLKLYWNQSKCCSIGPILAPYRPLYVMWLNILDILLNSQRTCLLIVPKLFSTVIIKLNQNQWSVLLVWAFHFESIFNFTWNIHHQQHIINKILFQDVFYTNPLTGIYVSCITWPGCIDYHFRPNIALLWRTYLQSPNKEIHKAWIRRNK